MTYHDRYTTCKSCQNAREVQSEACQVHLLFVIIHRLRVVFFDDQRRSSEFGQCKMQTADCMTGDKMQTESKMQTADQG